MDAGSDIFLTNSFGGNASRLKLHDADGRVFELNKAAAELGREVADASGRKVIVAGSVGPTGEIMEPMGSLTFDGAVEMFHEQAEGLKAGGADVLWVETISAPDEYKAAAKAAELAGMAWCGTMSFDTAGRTMMGSRQLILPSWLKGCPPHRSLLAPTVAWGCRFVAHSDGLCRTRVRTPDHCQGQRRHSEICRRTYPL